MPLLPIAAVIVVIGLAYLLISPTSASASPDDSGGSSVSGGNLTYDQISDYASAAGFGSDVLDTMTAIALAESSGNPSAVGDLNITPGGSIGLWQINLKAHPEYTQDELFDPQTNANAAFAVYQSQGLGAWSTYNNGAYEQYTQG